MSRPLAALTLALALVPLAGCGLKRDVGEPPIVVEEQAPSPGFGSAATATKDTVRIPGETPTDDAAGAASFVFPGTSAGTRPPVVVLVDQDDWQAGLAASVFAGGRLGAPILLTDGGDVPDVSAGALDRLDPAGHELIDNSQVIRIGDAGSPPGLRAKTITGADPYALAAAVDRFSSAVNGRPAGHVILASGEHPEFAMPAAPWAAHATNPILFTRRDSLPEPTVAALEERKKPDVFVLGPKTVIAQPVLEQLEKMGASVTRIGGDTPVENAIEFARFSRGTFGWGYVTPGHNFAIASTSRPLDAAASAVLGSKGVFAPLLVTDQPDQLPPPLDGYFLDVQPGYESDPFAGVYNRVIILGDESALSSTAQGRLDEITELVPVSTSNR